MNDPGEKGARRCVVVIGEQHGEPVVCGAIEAIHGEGLGMVVGHRFDSGLVQVGWMNPKTGVMCDCPVYETSPHANSVPVYKEVRRAVR